MADLPDLPAVLWDADDTVEYLRHAAQEGAEQVKTLRTALVTLLLAAPDHLSSTSLAQLATIVRLHALYLGVLRETLFAKDDAPYEDEAAEED